MLARTIPAINLRSLFAFGLVLTLHVVLIFVLNFKKSFTVISSEPLLLQFISIVESDAPAPKPTMNKVNSLPNPAPRNKAVTTANDEAAMTSNDPNTIHLEQPKLNLDASRAGAVEYELNRKRSAIELQNEKNRRDQSVEARMDRGTQRAQRTDCRTAYANTGLLAPLFITANLLGDKGCKF